MKASVRGEETNEFEIPRVLIVVRGGVVSVLSDDRADVYVVDYDNEPEAEIPNRYDDLLR